MALMMPAGTNPPGLEPRFRQPEGWRWETFKNPQGRTLRYGGIMPAKPDAVIIGLQGLSEFAEKYFETARTLLDHNCGFFMMDWQGQGKSERHLPNPHKRHSHGFDEDISDLHYFIEQHIKPMTGTTPLVMLGHSMGGNIGLRYLQEHPRVFACAAFSAPLVSINALKNFPPLLRRGLTGWFKKTMNRSYVFGGGNWRPELRGSAAQLLLSADPVRNKVHDAWCLHDPALQVGNVTFGWLYEANLSCQHLTQRNNITIPLLFVLAEKEHLVDNAATRVFAQSLPQAHLLVLPDSRHEILMERDGIRDAFFGAFFKLLKETLQLS